MAINPAEGDARADELVCSLYSSFPTELLCEMAEIGKKYEAVADKDGKRAALAMNAALQREIDRRVLNSQF